VTWGSCMAYTFYICTVFTASTQFTRSGTRQSPVVIWYDHRLCFFYTLARFQPMATSRKDRHLCFFWHLNTSFFSCLFQSSVSQSCVMYFMSVYLLFRTLAVFLQSSNCVVDSRFVLKLTDFGLHELRHDYFKSRNRWKLAKTFSKRQKHNVNINMENK